MNQSVHRHTPTLHVHDPRGLPVRNVGYLCKVASADAESLISRQGHDAVGRLTEQWDPRQFSTSPQPNLAHVYSLSGLPVSVDSVDAGWRLSLPGEAGQVVERWDARGNHWRILHDEQLRILSEASADQSSFETFTYADASADVDFNLCGQMTTLKDPAGTLNLQGFSLLGQVLVQTRSFDDSEAHTSRQTFGPLNQRLTHTDAGGHRQDFLYSVVGQLTQVALLRQGENVAKTIVASLQYNAAGQRVEQRAGNQVINRWRYDPANDWPINAQAGVTGQALLQNLEYAYDPVGNVLRIDDHTFEPVFFANRRIDGHRAFSYDSLYRLLAASGHEAATATDTPGRPAPSDPNNLHNYTQHYQYDRAGNLIELVHGRETTGYTRQMKVAPASNHALRWEAGDPPPDFAATFDAHGNQIKLRHGPELLWNTRDQLRRVTLLTHNNDLPDDHESYLYSQGMRVSKRHETHNPAASHFHQVRYLPDLEIRTRDNGEELHVITLPGNVRCLHWRSAPPAQVENNQMRYSLEDHLGSSTTELDQDAHVISQETYYPFGGTAIWLPASSSAVDYKTVRYSGKEMDVSGLYYYGARYYAPWLQRWVSADPAGDVDGLNLYVMVGNNPLLYIDPDGRARDKSPGWIAIAAGFKSETNRFVEEFGDDDNAMSPEQRKATTFKQFLSKKSGIGALTRGGVLGGSLGTSIGIAVGEAVPIENMSAYLGPVLGALGTYAGGHAYAYVRYIFFKNNVLSAATQFAHKQAVEARRLAESAQGIIPVDVLNNIATLEKNAMHEMTTAMQGWPAVDRLRFTTGTPAGESVREFLERFVDFEKTMLGGTADVVEPVDNESQGARSSISGSLSDFASAAGDSVQADNSWFAQFKGLFKRDKTPSPTPMESFA
ncbi:MULTISPECIES: RHS repeat-associated core domain-containing protein [unclassified Pseudomonas]|uniref:RHS repeat-associated core domain-containing protein n=1 Tax=unclassified Pseudomonas TaxID=196821 RepID=UPI001F56EC66|nr:MULTISPECIES: RHS repeat-associated core domain-containing protein [unclassified Pseudomonas]